MSIKEAIERYLFSRSKKLSDRTIRTYKRNLQKFAGWVGELTPISHITDDHIDHFQVSLKNFLTEKTQANYAHTLRAFFKHWVGRREVDVAWELIEGPRIPEKIPNHITKEQFDLIDDCLDEDEYYQLTKKLIFQLLWNTGVRIGELLALNISDMDTRKNYVFIRTEKSQKMRMVMWNDYCHQLLIKYLGVRVCLNKAPELFQTPANPRFISRRTRLSARSVNRWCHQLGDFLGFKINAHAFRHGKFHEALNQGASRHQIQHMAGHSSITSSEVYTRLNHKEQHRLLTQFLPEN